MFGDDFDMRDVQAWMDENAIHNAEARSDTSFIVLGLKRAHDRATRGAGRA